MFKPFSSFLPSPVFGQRRVIGLSPGNKSCGGIIRERKEKTALFLPSPRPRLGFLKGVNFLSFCLQPSLRRKRFFWLFFPFFPLASDRFCATSPQVRDKEGAGFRKTKKRHDNYIFARLVSPNKAL